MANEADRFNRDPAEGGRETVDRQLRHEKLDDAHVRPQQGITSQPGSEKPAHAAPAAQRGEKDD